MNQGGVLSNMIGLIADVWDVVSVSATFSILKGFLAVYIFFLIADIIMLLMLRPIAGDLKKALYGTKEHMLSSNVSLKKRWREIESRLSSARSAEWGLAVLQADEFIDRILQEMGYSEGRDLGTRLDTLSSQQFRAIDGLREAHEIRNRIVLEDEFRIDRAEAKRILEFYRAFLVEVEVLS